MAAFLQILGLIAVAAGFWLLAPWAGIVAVGVEAVACGVALDPPKPPKRGDA